MKVFYVSRSKGDVTVCIMRNESDNSYSFVNVTKGYICNRKFESEEDAITDLIKKKEEGMILDFYEY